MSPYHPHARRRRAHTALWGLGLVMGVLVLTFFRAQVIGSSAWVLRSDSNRLRQLSIPAPRGTVFDRHGRVIADNVPAYAISLLPAPTESLRASLERLREFVPMSDRRIERLLQIARRYPQQPLLVKSDTSFEEISAVQERRGDFAELLIEMRPKRRYLAGAAMAHVLGYVGEISAEELEGESYIGYEQGMVVGRGGVEEQYEMSLQGTQGLRLVEVDARGRIVGSFAGQARRPPVPGADIQLNLDVDLMRWIDGIFPVGMSGAVVMLDVSDGGVLALYSAPTFDPNRFVGGIEESYWQELLSHPGRPLFNKTLQGLYEPASTWKLATAAMGLDLGIVTPHEHMPAPCTGGLQFGNRFFRCWKSEGHGSLDLTGALAESCDVYFYQLGLRVGLTRFLEEGTRLGFSNVCGIDMPGEKEGIFPANRGYWERRFGYTPTEGEVLNLAIGQGPNSQTPLKMAQFYLAIGRGGTAPAPRIASEQAPPSEEWSLDLSQESLDGLMDGLRAVTRPGATAHLSSLEHWELMGKTGTGQNAQDSERDHAWFAGLAGPWGGSPEVAIVVLVEFGISGSGMAAPLAAKSVDYFLRRRYGIPIDTIQTFGEHLNAGLPAEWGRTSSRSVPGGVPGT